MFGKEIKYESELCKIYPNKIVDTFAGDGTPTGQLLDTVRFKIEDLLTERAKKWIHYRSKSSNELCFDGEFENIESQVYFMINTTDAIRGWHKHKHRHDHFIGVYGDAVISLTKDEENFECHNLKGNIIYIPPGIWHGIRGVVNASNRGKLNSVVANFCYPAWTEDNLDQETKLFKCKWETHEKETEK